MSDVIEETEKFGVTRTITRNGDVWHVHLTANRPGMRDSFSASADDGEDFMRKVMEEKTRELSEAATRARLPEVGDMFRHKEDPADMVKVVDVVEDNGGASGWMVVVEWPGKNVRHPMTFSTFETSYQSM